MPVIHVTIPDNQVVILNQPVGKNNSRCKGAKELTKAVERSGHTS